jgi:hypothetical protein
MIIISTHAPRMIPSEHLSQQRAGMNGIFDLSLVKNISLGKRFEFFDHTRSVTYFAVHRMVCRRLQHRRGMGWPSNYRTVAIYVYLSLWGRS